MNAAERGPARMEAFGPGSLGQELHRPGRLTTGNTEGGQQLGFHSTPASLAALAAAPKVPQVAVG